MHEPWKAAQSRGACRSLVSTTQGTGLRPAGRTRSPSIRHGVLPLMPRSACSTWASFRRQRARSFACSADAARGFYVGEAGGGAFRMPPSTSDPDRDELQQEPSREEHSAGDAGGTARRTSLNSDEDRDERL